MSLIDKELESILQSGNVWRRPDSGKQATILFLANMTLKGENAKKFPPQVVYVDEKGNINAVTVDRFVEIREYFMVNPTLEARILGLFQEEVDQEPAEIELEPVDPIDPELITTDADETSNEVEVLNEEPTPEDVESLDPPGLFAQFFSSMQDKQPAVDPIVLASNVLQYEQDPWIDVTIPSLSRIRHKLVISMAEGISINSLNDSFSPGEDTAYYKEFAINGIRVDWLEYQGAYPVISNDGIFASLVFTTPSPGMFEDSDSDGDYNVTVETVAATPVAPATTIVVNAQPVTPDVSITTENGVTISAPATHLSGSVQIQPTVVADEPVLKIIDDTDESMDENVIFGAAPSPTFNPTVQR